MSFGREMTLTLATMMTIFAIMVAGVVGLPNRSLGASETMEWSNKAEMPTGRYEPAVVVADGLLYAFGGQVGICSSTTANEVYDPSTDTWESLSPLAQVSTGLRGVALHGKIYLPGGWKGNPCIASVTTELNIYHPDTDSWTQGQPMQQARGRYGMALVDGLIYVMGGQDGSSSGCDSGSCETMEIYDPATDTWSEGPQLPVEVGRGHAAAVQGKVYLLYDWPGKFLIYDPVEESWSSGEELPDRDTGASGEEYTYTLVSTEDRIYIIESGHSVWESGDYLLDPAVHVYEVNEERIWTMEPSDQWLEHALEAEAALLSGKVYLAGGMTGPANSRTYLRLLQEGKFIPLNCFYVDGNNGDDGNEGSEANPWKTITHALDTVSGSEEEAVTIHVAAGTYAGSAPYNGETYPLNMESYVSLSGEDRDTTILDAENAAYHVILSDGARNLTIEGFTITAGYADGSGAHHDGAGIYCTNSSPTIHNNVITGNTGVGGYGGGICCNDSSPLIDNNEVMGNSIAYVANLGNGAGIACVGDSSPTIMDNTITDNDAGNGGGGISGDDDCTPTIENNIISRNTADDDGGGIVSHSDMIIRGNTISENTAANRGGGIYCRRGSPVIENNIVSGNEADDGGGMLFYEISSAIVESNCITNNSAHNDGGGVRCWNNSSPTIFNDLITANTAGGGIYCDDSSSPEIGSCTIEGNAEFGVKAVSSSPRLRECIIWGNDDDLVGLTSGVSYCNIEDGDFDGTGGNISEDPQFCSRGSNTNYDGYFLKQENDGAGWPATDWSPCIDAGGPSSNPFCDPTNTEYSTAVNGFLDTNTVDMGYHYKYHGCTYIELASFEAHPHDGSIILTWETGAEIDNAGFVIFRTEGPSTDYKLVSGFIPAEGAPASGASYSVTDTNVMPGVTYNYWLVDIETTGKWTAHGPVSARSAMGLKSIEFASPCGGVSDVRRISDLRSPTANQ